ncbi:MAG: hypothetical protein GF364_17285 [Candidatus Lokiarchaeota archaeon]|nr:hypothetical protein [Candidatus Lokiarchaeota archaeon]
MYILEIVKQFNLLMKSAIQGPSCIDPNICRGDCCHIHIDIPKALAEYYIEQNLAKKSDFIRGSVFSFAIDVKKENAKCVFFDTKLNGCSLHASGMKPPQCWIYPTGFSNEPGEEKQFAENGTIRCKKSSGWWVIDLEKTKTAQELLKKYQEFSEREFKQENSLSNIEKRLELLKGQLVHYRPSKIAGIKDGWDKFSPLPADGMSLTFKQFCGSKAQDLNNNHYFDCPHICGPAAERIIEKIKQKIYSYIEMYGAKETYTFYELFK